MKSRSVIKRSKSGKTFCSTSCSGKHNGPIASRSCGLRSKIEEWVESQLNYLYPNLNILYNDRVEVSPLELDIYIPSLSLAFEINGIFHYEPIFGPDRLHKIQNNDGRKFYLCQQKQINLCIIDISSMKYFKPKNAQKYLDIICDIINRNYTDAKP